MSAGIGGRGSARGRRLGLDAAWAYRTAPEKFSTHVLIAISLCNSGSNGIWSSKWVWNLAQSGRSGGCWKDERHVVSMSTGRWSEFSANTKSNTPGMWVSWLSRCTRHQGSGGVVWVSGWGVRSKDQTRVLVGIITLGLPPSCAQSRVPILVFGVEVAGHQDRQSLAITGGQVRSEQWARRRGVSRKDFHRFEGNGTWMAVASNWVRPGMGTEWWTIPRRTRMAVPPPAVGLSVRWKTIKHDDSHCEWPKLWFEIIIQGREILKK
jgi:hypothetical protein